jgi:hypothetical protein
MPNRMLTGMPETGTASAADETAARVKPPKAVAAAREIPGSIEGDFFLSFSESDELVVENE